MKAVHVICRFEEDTKRPKGIFKIEGKDQYISEAWDFSNEDAESLIGGTIFFHTAKSEKSFFGGTISAFEELYRDDLVRKERIRFTLTSTLESKNQPWRGMDHSMAWTSGIINIEDN
jgi:hypothetical protein